MDAFGDAVAHARDESGKAIHDNLSKVPLIGGVLGGVTDAAGVVVDLGGSVYSELMSTVGVAQNVSNVAGAKLAGASYVRSDAEAARGLSDEEKSDASLIERVRSEGLISGSIGAAIDGVSGVVSHVFGGDTQTQEDPAWMESLARAYDAGEISEDKVGNLMLAYDAGALTDDTLNDYANGADAGEYTWDALGTNVTALGAQLAQEDVATSAEMGSYESALSSMEVAARSNAACAPSAPEATISPEVEADGVEIG
jgi:hypothetical protein